jgi:uncharacterized NAD(P)/FAD-binding protein YdhS
MGAFPDDPQDFFNWTVAKALPIQQFMPREQYGNYLGELLQKSAAAALGTGTSLVQVTGNVVKLGKNGDSFVLTAEDGSTITADSVVVATGNLPQGSPSGGAELAANGLFFDPWRVDSFSGLKDSDSIFVLRTGLTAIDVILEFNERKLPNRIFAISRRGRFPQPHSMEPVTPLSRPLSFKGVDSARGLLQVMRERTRSEQWYSVVDSIRPDAQSIWADLPTAENRRFVRHLRRYWDAHRHRVPAEGAATLQNMIARGQLSVIAGNVKSVAEAQGKARVNFVRRGEANLQSIDCTRIINCTGPGGSIERTSNKFIAALISDRILEKDPIDLGVVVSRDFRGADRLFVIGSLLKGSLWETTSVPELRKQAAAVAELVGRGVDG